MINWHTSTPPQAPFFASIFNYYLGKDLEGYEAYDLQTQELSRPCNLSYTPTPTSSVALL